MEGKSTPGPWRPEPSRECVENVFDIRAGGAYGPCVAQWVDLNDAPIVAAAPDLLKGLMIAHDCLLKAGTSVKDEDWNFIEYAIAKAKGEA